ncbi:stage III sporulation protein AE [Clostridium tyrobutyricum]|jgi:stage III sporulation protein AE|uniref:Stage III sporulation protein AE n=2 Tax=Clostridium tyrobutyricum TaxID=1519 RepID=W6NDC2_CLOTY|nr:stage III sporulation protein AE [Clostridium tyrobutyricum]AND85210.1 stage III sporulation protein AE [Clostridium tyrobutyricum]ANP69767.1 stage III sporulation protein AE [Clostridium tyrobutyricum]MBR9646918.1 stage III sporulation protein AE [Clostridium tyrobutyricum]MBV4415213.1 stage III sporulation protein AE [Clostridium tyrobutyricum]MBV4420884.1 stage III sporulation protein AE [Clostridium tyrobutyricum]
MKNVILGLFIVLILGFNVQASDTSDINVDTNTSNINNSGNIIKKTGDENVENKVNYEKDQVDKLYDYISTMKTKNEMLRDIDFKEYVKNFMKSGDGKISVKKIINACIMYLLRELAASIKLLAILVIIAIICALITNLQRAFSSEGLSNIAYFACYSLLIIIMARSFYIGVDLARSTIKDLTDFMMALVPILIMLLTTVGGVVEATVMDPIVIGTINISAQIFMNFIIPLICMSFVLQFVNNLSSEYKIDKLTKLLNQSALWAQGIIMTIFVGIMTIRGVTSNTIDQVTAKTAKFAVDNFVPIVGKSLSDAVSTIAGYSLLIKNSLSSVGLVILILVLIFPVIKLGILIILYKLTAALIEPISDSRMVNCINSAGDSLTLITACLICISTMFFIMIAIIAASGKVMI